MDRMTKDQLIKELQIRDDMITLLADFITQISSGFDCPEGFFADKGDDSFFHDDKGEPILREWCSVRYTKDYWGEVDIFCDCEDSTQCWIRYVEQEIRRAGNGEED